VVRHTLEIRPSSAGRCRMSSEVYYSPLPPLQTILNAAGGRRSVEEGNASMLRRLGTMVSGGVDFDPVPFYNLVGRGVDLLGPLEDGARATLARLLLGLPSGVAGAGGANGAGLKVLEIGCGTGRWAKELLDTPGAETAVTSYVGIDSSETMALAAATELRAWPRARVMHADARAPGVLEDAAGSRLLGGTPDRIAMSYVMDILDEVDQLALLDACRDLLLRGGGVGKLGLCSICQGGPVMSTWQAAWDANPALVGGCRPFDAAALLRRAGWEVEAEERTEVLGYASQIIVASPRLPAAAA